MSNFGRNLALFRRLRTELLGEPLDAALGVDELLAAGEERVARRTDFEMQLRLGRACLEGVAAGATDLDLLILRVDAFLHGYPSCRGLETSTNRKL